MKLQSINMQTSRLNLAGLWNGVTSGVPVIALHGWLDNAASFTPLAGGMSLDRPFYAMELPGHGLSEHRAASASYQLMENIVDLAALVNEIAGESGRVVLAGHSLGGIICSLYAASAPDRVQQLILLDSLGPMTDETASVLPQLRRAMKRAAQFRSSKLTIYPSVEMAAKVRMAGVGRIGLQAAEKLVERGLRQVEGGYSWTSDPRLMEPSLLRFSEVQVEAIYSGIECPVCLICGSEGYFSDYGALEKRLSYINNLDKHTVSGGHHFHMEGDVLATRDIIQEFLKRGET